MSPGETAKCAATTARMQVFDGPARAAVYLAELLKDHANAA